MFRMFLLLGVASVLSGCASLSYPLPKCDGYSRRPLNRSMWQWEDTSSAKQQQQSDAAMAPPNRALAFADDQMMPPAAFAHFNVADSYRSCAGQG